MQNPLDAAFEMRKIQDQIGEVKGYNKFGKVFNQEDDAL